MIESLRISSVSQRVNIDKLLATVAFIFIATALFVVATTPPATGYEISIYDAYPSYFWFFIIAAIACGIIILVRQAFAETPSHWWIAGFLAIMFANLVILLLPIFRGYATMGRWDVLSHIGYTRDILLTGHLTSYGEAVANYYPVIHIITATLSHLTGLTPMLLAQILPIFFTLFYMISICLLSREITSNKGQAILITAFGSLLLFQHESGMLAPSIQCFFMLPFTLLLLYKTRMSANRAAYSLIFILILMLTPFFHPGEGSLFLFVAFLCIGFSLWLYQKVKRSGEMSIESSRISRIATISTSLILFIAWFSWFSHFGVFGGVVRKVWNWLAYGIGKPTAIAYIEILEKADLSLYEFIRLSLNMYGHAAFYFLTAGIIFIFVCKNFLSSRGKVSPNQFIFSFMFGVFSILLLVTFFGNVWLEYGRAMRYTIFAATILNGIGLYTLFHNWNKKAGTIAIVLLLIASGIIGVFNTHPSPIVRSVNFQVTDMEMTGMRWFLDHRDEDILVDNIDVNQSRFTDAIRGRQEVIPNIRYKALPLDHFGYPDYVMFGESFREDRYFVDGKISRIVGPEVFPEFEHLWKFTPEDFQRLDNEDPSVSKVYSNSEFWVYYVQGMGTPSP